MKKWIERLYLASPAPVQNTLVTAYGLKARRERFGDAYDRWSEFLRGAERFSRTELETYQNERLSRLIRHVYENVPYYRRVMKERGLTPDDFRTSEDLPKFPILTKELVRRHLRELIADGQRVENLKASPTSGTTGSPFVVYWDKETDVLWNAMIWRHRRWAGVEFGQRYGTLLGRVVVPPGQHRPPFWRFNRAWNQVLFSSFHLSPDNIPSYVAEFLGSRIESLEAYPSTAFILALGLERAGVRVPLRAVFTSSEPLLQMQRELIESRFETRVFDYFGMSEAIMFAGQCEIQRGMHHFAELSIVEVLDERGEPARDGQAGRLVGTNLHNLAMPLVRFEVGDLTARLRESCPCGRPHPLYSQVTTKAEDIVVTPDGRLISPSVLTHPFKPLKGLLKSQIIQETPTQLRVLLVAAGTIEPRVLEELRAGFVSRIGPGVRIDIEVVADIPVGPTGKFRWVISRVPLGEKLQAQGNLYTEDANRGGGSTS